MKKIFIVLIGCFTLLVSCQEEDVLKNESRFNFFQELEKESQEENHKTISIITERVKERGEKPAELELLKEAQNLHRLIIEACEDSVMVEDKIWNVIKSKSHIDSMYLKYVTDDGNTTNVDAIIEYILDDLELSKLKLLKFESDALDNVRALVGSSCKWEFGPDIRLADTVRLGDTVTAVLVIALHTIVDYDFTDFKFEPDEIGQSVPIDVDIQAVPGAVIVRWVPLISGKGKFVFKLVAKSSIDTSSYFSVKRIFVSE